MGVFREVCRFQKSYVNIHWCPSVRSMSNQGHGSGGNIKVLISQRLETKRARGYAISMQSYEFVLFNFALRIAMDSFC